MYAVSDLGTVRYRTNKVYITSMKMIHVINTVWYDTGMIYSILIPKNVRRKTNFS